jgi:phosphoglycerate dehydrogenase-like enzyme
MGEDIQVLFCGRSMHFGFQFTDEEARSRRISSPRGPNITVVQCDRDCVDESIESAHVVVPLMTVLDRARLQRARRAKLIIQYGAGVEGIDMVAAKEMGIYVSNIPSRDTGNADSCAEMAIFLALASLRQINAMQRSVCTGALGVPIGRMLKGSTVCVVGNGNISRALRPRLRGFEVTMCVLTRTVDDELLGDDDVSDAARVDDVAGASRILGRSDIVVFACPVNDVSRGMMNERFLRRCKDGVVIVNVARGGLLDYDATLLGLKSGKIGGLGLDVQWEEPMDPEDPILEFENVYVTPHVAGVTHTSYRHMARVVIDQAIRVAVEGRKPDILLN